jgi:hypothetical protein
MSIIWQNRLKAMPSLVQPAMVSTAHLSKWRGGHRAYFLTKATIMPPVTENMKQKEQIKVARTIIMNGLGMSAGLFCSFFQSTHSID